MIDLKEVALVGGAIVTIPVKFSYFKCRNAECGADNLIWAKTKNGKSMPIHFVEGKGFVSHFSDCVGAKEFRGGKK